MRDNYESGVDVPEKPNKDTFESPKIGLSDSYLHDNYYECNCDQENCDNYNEVNRKADPKGQNKEKFLKHNHKEMKSNESSFSKKYKDIIKKIHESEHQDKDPMLQNSVMLLKGKVIQEYTNILETIKEQNKNLQRIKMNMLTTQAKSNRQGLEPPYGNEEEKFNAELFKALVLQSKCPDERWPENPAITKILKESSGSPEQDLEDNVSVTASEEENSSYGNVSRSSSLEGSLYSSATDPEDVFKGLVDKVNSMVTCFNESKDLNDKTLNLLKSGREHLKRCSPSFENCKKLEKIFEELQSVRDQKLKQISNEKKIRGQTAAIGRIGAGQANIYNDSLSIPEQYPTKDKCRYSRIPAPSEITESDLCCCKPKSEPNKGCCCSEQKASNSDRKIISIFERVASELKDFKKKQKTKFCPPPPQIGALLIYKIRCLRKKMRALECENTQWKCIHEEQQAETEDFKERYINAKQAIEKHSSKIDEIAKQNKDIVNKIQDKIEETKKAFDNEVSEYPKLLKEERNKFKECLKEKEMLQEKLAAVEDSLKKEQEKVIAAKNELSRETELLKADIAAYRDKSSGIENVNEVQRQSIVDLKTQLSEERNEATALRCKLQERFERQLSETYQRIRGLEEDLARERSHNFNAMKENDNNLPYVLHKLQNSQLKVKKLQGCVISLIDQIRTQREMTCCPICKGCNRVSSP